MSVTPEHPTWSLDSCSPGQAEKEVGQLLELLSRLPQLAADPEVLAAYLSRCGAPGRAAWLRARATRLLDLAHLLAPPTTGAEEGGSRPPGGPDRPFAVYYGVGAVHALSRYRTVVVHPGQHTPAELELLRRGGTRVLAYLSVGEDGGPPAPWQLNEVNPAWNTRHVSLENPGWHHKLRTEIEGCLPSYQGFFLDTLDVVDVRREVRPEMLRLLRKIRGWTPGSYLLANRGFSLLPELGKLADGVLIESFSTTWEDDYRRLDDQGLAYTDAMKRRVQDAQLDIYALDYANTAQLERFARQRAARLKVPTFITRRELNQL